MIDGNNKKKKKEKKIVENNDRENRSKNISSTIYLPGSWNLF
jgi:hypothetical protein